MEHSLEKYLERQSTEKLKIALQGLRQEAEAPLTRAHICMIMQILKNGVFLIEEIDWGTRLHFCKNNG